MSQRNEKEWKEFTMFILKNVTPSMRLFFIVIFCLVVFIAWPNRTQVNPPPYSEGLTEFVVEALPTGSLKRVSELHATITDLRGDNIQLEKELNHASQVNTSLLATANTLIHTNESLVAKMLALNQGCSQRTGNSEAPKDRIGDKNEIATLEGITQ